MNKDILMALDHLANPDKYTKVQLKDNAEAAYDAYRAASATVYRAGAVYRAAAHAADDAYDAAYYDNDEGDIEYWVDEYFLRSGENKQDYIKELNK